MVNLHRLPADLPLPAKVAAAPNPTGAQFLLPCGWLTCTDTPSWWSISSLHIMTEVTHNKISFGMAHHPTRKRKAKTAYAVCEERVCGGAYYSHWLERTPSSLTKIPAAKRISPVDKKSTLGRGVSHTSKNMRLGSLHRWAGWYKGARISCSLSKIVPRIVWASDSQHARHS
jgi:hypothetical protein